MCSRYLIAEEHLRAILIRLGVPVPAGLPGTRYNVPPGRPIPTIRAKPRPGDAAAAVHNRVFAPLTWGLVPSWARTDESPIVNARAESIADKPSFRDAFRRRRCLIPASGFYEWKSIGSGREPWLFRRRDDAPFGLAGLWDTWTAPDGEVRESCAVITTAPNALMTPIHHRMPVMLDEAAWEPWLDPDLTEPTRLAPLLEPWAPETMTAVAVSRRVNHAGFDDPSCLQPVAPEAAPRADPQLGLDF